MRLQPLAIAAAACSLAEALVPSLHRRGPPAAARRRVEPTRLRAASASLSDLTENGCCSVAAGSARGLRAARAVRRGEVLVRTKAGLTVASSKAALAAAWCKPAAAMDEWEPWAGAVAWLAAGLLAECAAPSDAGVEAWVASLPAAVDIPLNWDAAALAELARSSTRPFGDLAEDLAADHEWVAAFVALSAPDPSLWTLERFSWAAALVLSRAVMLDGVLTVAPAIDHAAHADAPNAAVRAGGGLLGKLQGSEGAAELVALEAIPAGAAVTVDYAAGERVANSGGAALFLEQYGFVPRAMGTRAHAALHGRAEVRLEVAEDDRFFDDKESILEEADLEPAALFYLSAEGSGEVDPDAHAFLRLAALSGADSFLLEPIFRGDIYGFISAPVSRENEAAAAATLVAACDAGLAATAWADDEADAAAVDAFWAAAAGDADDDPAARRAAAAAAVRLDERAALRVTKRWIERDVALLDDKEYYQERRLKDLGLDRDWNPDDSEGWQKAGNRQDPSELGSGDLAGGMAPPSARDSEAVRNGASRRA